ncbi:MAG: lipopolysaccharide biosynthesis protein [Pyrinomonadaceae bacterium]
MTSLDDKTTLTSRAAWLVLGKTLAFFFAFALPLLLVRRMSQYEFGLYKQIFLFVTTAMMLLPLGFHMSAYYFLPREPQWGKQVVLNILLFEVLVAIIACVVIVLWPSLLMAMFKSDEIARLSPSIALAVLTFIVSALLDHMILARGETKLATVLVVASQLTKTLALLTAAIVFGTVRSLLYASIIQASIQVFVLMLYLRARFANFWRAFNWGIFREQLGYALPLGIASQLWMLQTTLDNFFVSYTFGPGDYAIYAVGCFQLPLVVIVTESLGLTTIPRLSQMQKEGRMREIRELLARMMRKQAAIFVPLYVLLLVIGREFIVALFTRQYLASWPIFAINLILVPLAIVTSATDPVMRSYSEHRYFLLRLRIALVALLATALWFGTARYGLIGAISIMAGVNIIQTIIIAVKTTRILQLSRSDWLLFRDFGKILLASVLAGVAALLIKIALVGSPAIITVLVCGAVFGMVYLCFFLLFKTPTPEEREGLGRMATRLWQQLFSKSTSPVQSL